MALEIVSGSQQPTPHSIATLHPKFSAFMADLNATMIERPIEIMISTVGLISQQHVVFLGEPGVGKSQLVVEICKRITMGQAALRAFVRLLTKFTTPEELFGVMDLKAFDEGEYRRRITGMLPTAYVAFLDEVFKAGSAILNALLTILNEGQFDDGSERIEVPLKTLFGASNELPQGSELEALRDRFSLWCEVQGLSDQGMEALYRAGGRIRRQPAAFLSIEEIQAAHDLAEAMPVSDQVILALVRLRRACLNEGIFVSVRKAGWALGLVKAHALLMGRAEPALEDLAILEHAYWRTPDQKARLAALIAKQQSETIAAAREKADTALIAFKTWEQNRANVTGEAATDASVKLHTNLRITHGEIKALLVKAQVNSEDTGPIERYLQQVRDAFDAVTAAIQRL